MEILQPASLLETYKAVSSCYLVKGGVGLVSSVVLVFPPLVESNFGSIYPAGPILAAFLEEQGIAVSQLDLNEDFAEYLLTSEVLGCLGAGRLPNMHLDSVTAAAARWAYRHRYQLIDAQGRHLFGADRLGTSNHYAYIPELLAKPYFADASISVINGESPGQHIEELYANFLETVDVSGRIPHDPSLIAITVAMGPQLAPSLLLAQYLRTRVGSTTKIIFGGATLSLMAERDIDLLLKSHECLDGIVRYDGEGPLLQLAVQASARTWSPDKVGSFSYRIGRDVRHTDPSPGFGLDQLPAPVYPSTLLERLADPILGITQARGCYWGHCDYCDFVEVYGGSPSFRSRRPEAFVREIEQLMHTTGIRRFRFITESIPPAFARRTSKLLIDRQLDIRWSSFIMVDRRFDRGLLQLMSDAGCELLVVGLETMNTRVLKLVHKSADREENIRFLRDARDAGVRLSVNLIPDLPTTTYAEALSSLAELRDLTDCMNDVSVFEFEPTRSSNLGRNPIGFGLVPSKTSRTTGQAQYELNTCQVVDPAMSPEERLEVYALYRTFAEESKTKTSWPAIRAENPSPEGLYRLMLEEVDVIESRDRQLSCTQFKTRRRVRIPARSARYFRRVLTGAPFRLNDICGADDESNVWIAVKQMLRNQILTRVE